MEIIRSIEEARTLIKELKSERCKIGLVPTMGYLHEGHLSLIQEAKKRAEKTFVSIYVNPTQFGPKEDFSKYPRNLKRDSELAEYAGANYLFVPTDEEMYPEGYSTFIEVGGAAEKFEGEKRPGHFKGVATIVGKLFNIIEPDYAVFGQKDYQQCLVIKKMTKELNFNTRIVISPIVREVNGLAKSSRNSYLSDKEREEAAIINKSLNIARESIRNGEMNREKINAILSKSLRSCNNIIIDYAESALADSLEKPDNFLPGQEIVLLAAAYLGKTRLIDNLLIEINK